MSADNNTPVGIICKGKCDRDVKKILHKLDDGPWVPRSPTKSAFVGAGLPAIRCPPVTGSSPELRADSHSVLRRTKARRRYEVHTLASSGEANPNRNWRLPPVSAFLNGVGLFGIHLPPITGFSPELSADSHPVLRRTTAPRRYDVCPRSSSGKTNPNRNWRLPPVSVPLDGVGLFGIRLPPASECWPELRADSHSVLRRTKAPRRYEFHTRT